ncbi:hypothetical protein E5Q_03290 [Mixia osmundae IAM 14324]|uniref:Uncharacterized protein n=1 Tax=Mixia osmundae (strain CBS 9802 / IAM 14324 / JCM 22182 / KY 12970) TaxID=764103 RepID=G7E1B0_MIXOS|nr:hypothetical protein E5Q_03290 [Mixia osmundae IAM 14324]
MVEARKQFTLYSHKGGPNGWKVALVLSELGLSSRVETIYLDFSSGEHKRPPYITLNPNARYDDEFVVWESNAIIKYLVDRYDPEHKISATGDDIYLQDQWLSFQASGQGSYFAQGVYFHYFDEDQNEVARTRYENEILRVFGVLESVLSQHDWLVGDKYSVADLAFLTWNQTGIKLTSRVPDFKGFEKDFPLQDLARR